MSEIGQSTVGVLAGWQPRKDGTAASDANILNAALRSEFEAVAAYQLAADSGLLEKPVLDVAMKFQGQHQAHADFLASTVKTLGGKPAEPKKAAGGLRLIKNTILISRPCPLGRDKSITPTRSNSCACYSVIIHRWFYKRLKNPLSWLSGSRA